MNIFKRHIIISLPIVFTNLFLMISLCYTNDKTSFKEQSKNTEGANLQKNAFYTNIILFIPKGEYIILEEDRSIDLWQGCEKRSDKLKLNESKRMISYPEEGERITEQKLIEIGINGCKFKNISYGFQGKGFHEEGEFYVVYSPSIFEPIFYNNFEEFAVTLNKETNINKRDGYGRTALMLASFYGRKKMAEMLLEKGADVNAKDNNNHTALMMAAKYPDIMQLLIDKKAEVNWLDNEGRSVLFFALYDQAVSDESLTVLLKSRADINQVLKTWPFSTYGFKDRFAGLEERIKNIQKAINR